MNVKQLLVGLSAVAMLAFGSGAHAAVVVKQTGATQASQSADAGTTAKIPRTPEERCAKRPADKQTKCLCKRGVTLPDCPPSNS
ncbi:hypothetical protein KAK07_07255 [Ideonella sp. 4Y16]|uniref:hypothetical protein n=1 Tax=Ideonella alba TaxID=2824118 RepID=UPI001B38E13C|nr:hypothetical protein [Ideonella alba]MBQ0943129.1 hypothetical protein [Ideonella alba]